VSGYFLKEISSDVEYEDGSGISKGESQGCGGTGV
jgi:hypothetical protein